MSKEKFTLSLYWKCQVVGWSLAALYWGYTGYIGGGFNWALGLLQFITDVALYILLTHGYRNFSKRRNWQNLDLSRTVVRLIPSILLMGVAYTLATAVKVFVFRSWFTPGYQQPFALFLELNGLNILIAGIRLMSIWLLAYHLYQYAQREIRVAKDNARLAVITRDAQLNNLSAQLNPHFLFNSLNTIKSLVADDPASARRGIDLLADLLRNGLYQSDQLITIREEMELVADYLELEKLRMEERLSTNITLDEAAVHCRLPRFSIQTLVENAVKHGIARQKEGGQIRVRVSKDDRSIRVTVENPGELTINGQEPGIGLKNLQERLLLQYQGAAKFTIAQQPGSFVLATLSIPLP